MNEEIAIKICEQMKDDIDNLCDCCRKDEKNRTCIGCRELAIETILKENARLKDKLNKINDLLNEPIFEYDNIPCNIENEIIQLKDILKQN